MPPLLYTIQDSDIDEDMELDEDAVVDLTESTEDDKERQSLGEDDEQSQLSKEETPRNRSSMALGTQFSSPDLDFTFSNSANVLVGLDQVSFSIHPSVVANRSPVLASAIAERWNPRKKAVELPDEVPEIFDLYLQYVYTGTLVDEECYSFARHIQLYITADRLNDIITANLVMDSIIRKTERNSTVPHAASIQYAYDSLPESSPLLKLFVMRYVMQGSKEAFEQLNDEYPAAFLADIAKKLHRLARLRGWSSWRLVDGCAYHMHDASHPKCKEDCTNSEDDTFSLD